MRRLVEAGLRDNWRRLHGYAFSLCKDAELARDLLQTSAANALGTSASPTDPAAVRAWLFRVMRNAWFDRLRREAVRAHDAPPPELAGGPWAYEDGRIATITVRQSLERIEPHLREAIELIDLAGFTYAEAAEIVGVPIGTIMSRISRARLALLEAIEKDNVTPMGRARSGR